MKVQIVEGVETAGGLIEGVEVVEALKTLKPLKPLKPLKSVEGGAKFVTLP